MFDKNYKPDILNCMANLSNDEVFTSPQIANQMLDMLPQELFESTETTFLDPCCKTGVFLREITKRLLKAQIPNYETKLAQLRKDRDIIREILNEGNSDRKEVDIDILLEDEAPESNKFLKELQLKLDHILTKQVFGIAITELTALMSRRTLYCSKDSNAKYSIVEGCFGKDTRPTKLPNGTIIDNLCNEGNIIFDKLDHKWGSPDKDGSCTCELCGANSKTLKRDLSLETYAYPFIHWSLNEIERRINMGNFHIDVVATNPPYQLQTAESGQAKPLYNKFVEQIKRLNPKYITMIIPSRWMVGGMGLDQFRKEMIAEPHLKEIYDFEDAKECFPGVHIDSGVCYFLIDQKHKGLTKYVYKTKNGEIIEHERTLGSKYSNAVIRDYRLISILEKIESKNEGKFRDIVSTMCPYKIATDYFNSPENYQHLDRSETPQKDYYHIFGVKGHKGGAKRTDGYVSKKSVGTLNNADKYNLFFSATYSTNAIVPPEPIFGKPDDICTATFLNIGPFETEQEQLNCNAYMHTNFFRVLLYLRRGTIHVTRDVFELIPLQDFSKVWTDKDLYAKYGLTPDEIAFIESNIKEDINGKK